MTDSSDQTSVLKSSKAEMLPIEMLKLYYLGSTSVYQKQIPNLAEKLIKLKSKNIPLNISVNACNEAISENIFTYLLCFLKMWNC